jgi:hypothetical protein
MLLELSSKLEIVVRTFKYFIFLFPSAVLFNNLMRILVILLFSKVLSSDSREFLIFL